MRLGKKLLALCICFILVLVSVAVGGNGVASLIDKVSLKASAVEYEVGDIIEFGSYPQSDVTASLGQILNTLDGDWISYDYYSGTGDKSDGNMVASNYMRYKDVVYSGDKYRGVLFDKYRPLWTGDVQTSSNSYQDDNGYISGTTYWFKFEPVKWRILNPLSGLLMSETIIDSQPFNNFIVKMGKDGHNLDAYYGDSGKSYFANNYVKSSIREWLNKDFYETAFNNKQKDNIEYTEISNKGFYTISGITGYEDYDNENTTDKVFFLSYHEMADSSYGFNPSAGDYDVAREGVGSDYAKCQGLYVIKNSSSDYTGNSWWWLRSSGMNSDGACGIREQGNENGLSTFSSHYGVRPAIKVKNIYLLNNTTQYPYGYDPNYDRWSFHNQCKVIPPEIYVDILGIIRGTALYYLSPEYGKTGTCFGMAASTGLFLSYPIIDKVLIDPVGKPGVFATYMTDCHNGCKTDRDPREYDSYITTLSMYLSKLIMYGQITQESFSTAFQYKINDNNFDGLYNSTLDYVNGDGEPIVVTISGNYNGNGKASHSVFVCGIGNDDENQTEILVNDSNHENIVPCKLILRKNSNGSYSGWEYIIDDNNHWGTGKEYADLTYTFPIKELLIYSSYGNAKNTIEDSISKMNRESNLLILNGDSSGLSVDEDAIYRIKSSSGFTETGNSASAYWLEPGINNISFTSSSDDSSITFANNQYAVGVTSKSGSVTDISLSEENYSASIKASKGDDVEFAIHTLSSDNDEYNYTINGTVDDTEATVESNDNSVIVNGLNNIEVSLNKDEENDNAVASISDGRQLTITIDEGKNTVTTDFEPEDVVKSFNVSDTKVLRGKSLDWTVTTLDTVDTIRLKGTYTSENGTKKALTYIYMADQEVGNLSVSDEGGIRSWNIRMPFTYSVADDRIEETWTLSCKIDELTAWNDYDETKTITVARKEYSLNENTSEYEPFTLVSVSGPENVQQNKFDEITIVTTNDCTKVRISVNGKNATYMKSSTNVTDTENEDGTTTWVIRYKFTQAGENTYFVSTRGPAWSEAKTFTATVA